MFGFLTEIGTFLSGVGTSIMNGLSNIGTFLSENVWTPLSNFVSEIPTMVSEGWGWLTDKVGGMLGLGDSASTAASMAPAAQATASTSEFLVNAPTAAGTMSATSMLPVGGVSPGITGGATQGIAATGGLMGAPGVTSAAESFIPKAMKFLSTPVGQITAKGAVAGVTAMMQQRQQREAIKAMEKEQRRQEAEARRDWLMQQQMESENTKWQATRQNEVGRANAQNQWAGASGVWMNPTTDVPMPQGA